MDAFLVGLSTGLTWLLQSSWQGALLVVLILAVQAASRGRLSPQWRHALWGLLIVRLLLVWAPPAPWSVYNVVGPEAPVAVYLAPAPEAPAIEAPRIEAPTQAEDALPPAEDTPPQAVGGIRGSSGESSIGSPLGARDAVTLGWLGVTALLLSAMLYQTLRFGRHVRAGRLVTDSATLDLLEECRSRLRVSTYLAVVETDCVRSPALLGCIRPKLLLPRGFLADLPHEDMRYIFLHELAHVKRGDIWSSWLINLLTAAHWFNPLIWYARRRFIADREAACDAHVLAALDESAQRAYGHTVLNLMQRFNAAQWAPGIAGISENNSNLKRRILMIKHFRSPTRLAAWVGAGLCVGIGLATLTNAQEPRKDVNAIRKEAVGLAEQGRFNEAVALLDKGRLLSGDVWDDFTALIVKYKLTGDMPLTPPEKEYLVRQLESASAPQDPVIVEPLRGRGAPAPTTAATPGTPILDPARPIASAPSGEIPGTSQVSYLEEQLARLQDLQERNEKDPASSIYDFGIEKLAITDPRVSALETELAKLEVEADRLREEYVEGHPVLTKSLQEVDILRKNIAKQTAIARANAIKIMRSEVTQQLELARRSWDLARTQEKESEGQWAEQRSARTGSGANYHQQNSSNSDDGEWVYFSSMETGEGPELILEETGEAETVPVTRDAVLISYLAYESWSGHQQLSVNLNDMNRVLMAFDLPAGTDAPPLARAVLRLDLRQSGKPTTAPFAMAVHRVTESWGNDCTWHTQPRFEAEPSAVVMVPIEPGTVDIDVTQLVKAWTGGSAPNYGLVLKVAEPFYGPPRLDATPLGRRFSDKEVREMPLEEIFQFMAYGRVGYPWNSAHLALVERAKLGAESRVAILEGATRRLQHATWGYERRCCALLLGALGDRESIPKLVDVLKIDEAGVRESAAIALGLFEASEAKEALEAAVGGEGHARVRTAIQSALAGAYQALRPANRATGAETSGEESLVEVVDGNVVVTRTVPGAFGTPRETARPGAADSGVASSGINVEETETVVNPTAPAPSTSRAAPTPTDAARLRADCQNHLKQLGLSLKIFASESEGAYWPTLSTEPGRLMFDAASIEKYLQGGPAVCACPGQGPAPESPDDRDYFYPGFVLQNDEDVRQFASAYHHVSTGLPDALEVWIRGEVATFPPSDSPSPRAGAPRVRRLREGVERFFITDINNPAAAAVTQSNIPVIIEWPDHHPTGTGKQGGNILYMDGHVEFVAYPGKWPMTEETMKILCDLAGREPIAAAN